MKSSVAKIVMELKGELTLIMSTDTTWDIWCCVFDSHNNGDIANPETETTYKNDPKLKVPPIFRELLKPLQGLAELELH